MRILRYLQHWLRGPGRPLIVADFVPETHPLRQWADTFPWAALVAAVERNFTQRFPTPTARGRAPVATRVVLALELLKHELHCSDEQICSQLRTDLAVMYACGITAVQVNRTQEHFVLPELLTQFRSRLDEALPFFPSRRANVPRFDHGRRGSHPYHDPVGTGHRSNHP